MQSIVPMHYYYSKNSINIGYCIMIIFMLPVDLVIPSTGSRLCSVSPADVASPAGS